MKQAGFLVGLVGVATVLAAACGGRAALEAYDDNTELSQGGAPPSSSGTGGTPTGTTSSTTWTTSSTTWTTSTTTTQPPPPTCDFSGSCDNCVQCAFEGPCTVVWDECLNSPACMDFMDCVNNCNGPPGPCMQSCSQGNQLGAQQYIVAVQCILCDVCASDCDGQAGPICNQ